MSWMYTCTTHDGPWPRRCCWRRTEGRSLYRTAISKKEAPKSDADALNNDLSALLRSSVFPGVSKKGNCAHHSGEETVTAGCGAMMMMSLYCSFRIKQSTAQ